MAWVQQKRIIKWHPILQAQGTTNLIRWQKVSRIVVGLHTIVVVSMMRVVIYFWVKVIIPLKNTKFPKIIFVDIFS